MPWPLLTLTSESLRGSFCCLFFLSVDAYHFFVSMSSWFYIRIWIMWQTRIFIFPPGIAAVFLCLFNFLKTWLDYFHKVYTPVVWSFLSYSLEWPLGEECFQCHFLCLFFSLVTFLPHLVSQLLGSTSCQLIALLFSLMPRGMNYAIVWSILFGPHFSDSFWGQSLGFCVIPGGLFFLCFFLVNLFALSVTYCFHRAPILILIVSS